MSDDKRIQLLFQKLDKKKKGFLDAQQFEVYLNSIEGLLHHHQEGGQKTGSYGSNTQSLRPQRLQQGRDSCNRAAIGAAK